MKKFRIIALALAVCAIVALPSFAGGKQENEKVLNRAVVSKLQPFNIADLSDLYTSTIAGDMMEGLFQYKYLTDAYELEPLIATAMPKVSADGLTYTFTLRKDAYYYDPTGEVFKAKKGRAVMAKDFVLSFKRLADPEINSSGWWLFDGFIKGLNEWHDAAAASGKADYSKEVEGVKALDDYTLQLTLTQAYPQILYTLAMPYTYPTCQEEIDVRGEEWVSFPMGSGAYYMDIDETIPDNQYVLKKNPTWHGGTYPTEIGSVAKGRGLGAAAGKKLPFVDKVVYYIVEEDNPRWLKFMNGEIDYITPPKDFFGQAVVNNKLTPEMAAKNIRLDIDSSLDVTYDFFNTDISYFQNRKLRQAMTMAYNVDKAIEIFYNGRAISAQTVLPPGLGGYDPNYKNPYKQYNLAKAKQLLAEAGYPDGKGLPTFKYQLYSASATTRQMAEFYVNAMKDIGINIELVPGDWATYLDRVDKHECELGGNGWGADYPDGQNFLQLQYGPNAAPGPNAANYDNPEFNALYDKAIVMQQGPARDAAYAKLAQMAAEDCAIRLGVHRRIYSLVNPWLMNWEYRDIGAGYSKYYDIDVEGKAKALSGK